MNSTVKDTGTKRKENAFNHKGDGKRRKSPGFNLRATSHPLSMYLLAPWRIDAVADRGSRPGAGLPINTPLRYSFIHVR
jgi:hypothetical protein